MAIGRPRKRWVEIGQRFGRLVAVEEASRGAPDRPRWVCRCDCGGTVTVNECNLWTGNTASCGCLRLERLRAVVTTHGRAGSKEHHIWLNMIQRCTNPRNTSWSNYGGRGITICPEWQRFEAFYGDMGAAPEGMTLDRKDVDGPYSPANCRWATRQEQARNTRRNRMLTYDGRTQTLSAWSAELGIPYWTLHARVRSGWSDEGVLGVPVTPFGKGLKR